MQNILLLVPSLYKENGTEQEFPLRYNKKKTISVRHTNLPVFCSISEKLGRKGQIDAVLFLSSKEVTTSKKMIEGKSKTTLNYLKEQFCDYQNKLSQPAAKFISVDLPSKEIRNTNSIQNKLNKALKEIGVDGPCKIWVDFTSGLRSHAILLIFLLRFLEMSNTGHQVQDILYANMTPEEQPNEINSCLPVYRLFSHYQLLDQFSSKAPDRKLIGTENDTNWQIQIIKSINDLNSLYNTIKTELLNTSGNTTGKFEKVVAQAQEYVKEFPEVPMMSEIFRRIQDEFNKKEDILSSTEYLLEIGMPSLAMVKLRENAFRYLIGHKVIQTELQASAIENELLSASRYYNTFICYIRSCLQLLHKNPDLEPEKAIVLDQDYVLKQRYWSKEHLTYSLRTIVSMNENSENHFNNDCKLSVKELNLEFAERMHELSQKTPIAENAVKEYESIRLEYSEKRMHFRNIYQMSGFPFPCYDHIGAVHYAFYKRYLTLAAEELIRFLKEKKLHVHMSDSFKHISLRSTDFSQLTYRKSISECYARLPQIIALKFSHQSDRDYEHGWSSGIKNDVVLQEFLNEYLPIHQLVRESRNSFAHPDETWIVDVNVKNEVELSDRQKALLNRVKNGEIRLATIVAEDRKVIERYMKDEEIKLLLCKLVSGEIKVEELEQQQRKDIMNLLETTKEDNEELTPDEKGVIIKTCLHMLRNIASKKGDNHEE